MVRAGSKAWISTWAIAVALAAQSAVQARVPEAPATAQPSHAWAQKGSDVAADGAVRFGTLPNGMRYAILRNATPPGRASLRLRIDAGSLMEKDSQLGLAHFMEHMAFNGTTHIPKNDLIKILERLGLAFGADLNAATSFDETFYQLDLPHTDAGIVDTALHVMREQVSEALMQQAQIEGERGVIHGEERLRNSPGLRAGMQSMDILAKGQLVPKRFPIGDMKVIDTAPRDRFVQFYNAYYRPSRATLIAVGDFDVDAMEAHIRQHFSDWAPKASDGPEPDLGQVATRSEESHVIVVPGTQPGISLNWTTAPDEAADTLARRHRDTVRSLAMAVLNRRLAELSRTDDPPFISAQIGHSDLMKSVGVTSVSATVLDGKWQKALQAIEQEKRRLVEYGISDAELEREVTGDRTRLTTAAASADTRNSNQLAAQLVQSVNDDEVFTSPKTDLALFEADVKGLHATEVSQAIPSLFTANGPIAILTTPTALEGGDKAVAQVLDSSQQVAVAAPAVPGKKEWTYTNFGSAGSVASRRELPELGATVVTFANGTELTFKHTDFSKDGIGIVIQTGIGNLNFSPKSIDVRQSAVDMLRDGGLAKLTNDELSRTMSGHELGAGFSSTDHSFVLNGGTRPSDLQLEMQVLAAFLIDPAYRSAPYEKLKATYPESLALTMSLPGPAFSAQGDVLLAGGDQRKAIIPAAVVAASSMDAFRPSLKEMISKGPIRITIVGDTTLDDAIAVTANTFGALPTRAAANAPAEGAAQRHFPAGTPTPLHFTHTGLAEQGLGFIAWPAVDSIDSLEESERVGLLTAVLRLRMLDVIREQMAIAYSPGASDNSSDTFKGYGYIAAQAQTSPDKLPAFFAAMARIAADLRDKPISADEMKRAREPLVEAARRNESNNSWWIGLLSDAAVKPERSIQALHGIDLLKTMTPADVQALARKYLQPTKAWKAEVTAAGDSAAGRVASAH